MSKIIIHDRYYAQLRELDSAIAMLNAKKTRLLFEALGIAPNEKDLALMQEWDLILVAVPDKQMAIQLNKLSAYIPNLKFVVDAGRGLFTLSPGKKSRRVWKER